MGQVIKFGGPVIKHTFVEKRERFVGQGREKHLKFFSKKV